MSSFTTAPTGAQSTVNWGLEGGTTRNLQVCSNGNLWYIFYDGTATTDQSVEFRYSTDNGATWNAPGVSSYFGFTNTTNNRDVVPSMFIDIDDYAHAVYKDRSDGFIYYRRGTPNAGRTAWTWSAALLIDNATASGVDEPTVVAHREGAGWKAHIISSVASSNTIDSVRYSRIDIASDGTLTADVLANVISHVYQNWNYKRPVIDFRHTGDGKTIDTKPDIFIAWNSGDAAVANQGTWFVKATYSGGDWTFGPLRNIESTSQCSASNQWMQGFWDAVSQRFVFGGYGGVPATGGLLHIYGRNLDDTSTSTILYQTPAVSSTGTSANYGALATDAIGRYYLTGDQTTSNPSGLYRVVLFEIQEGAALPTPTVLYSYASGATTTPARVKMLPHAAIERAFVLFQTYDGVNFPQYFSAYTASPLPFSAGIAPAIETNRAFDPADPNLYPLVMPTYEVTDTRRRPYVRYHQGLSVVKIAGTWTVLSTPTRETLAAAGAEGVGWFRGGHLYEVSASLAAELISAGIGVEALEKGYGLSGYGYGTYGG